MDVARWVRRLALTGALGFVVAAGVAGGADASSKASPPDSFSSTSTAVGVEYSFDEHPQPTPVGDLIHGASPRATSNLGDGSDSAAKGNSVFIGGFEGVPGLLCTAGLPCDSVPAPGGFPPPFPFEANAQYPTHQHDRATTDQGPVGGHGAPLTAQAGTAEATARASSNSALGQASSSTFGPGLVTTGAMVTRAGQRLDARTGDVVSTAESTVHDITIAKLIKIGSVHSITTIRYNGTGKPRQTTSTTVGGVSVLGLAAAIDDKGIHVVGQGDKAAVRNLLNKQLAYLLSVDGISVVNAGATATRTPTGMRTQAGGLLITFDDTVSGVPQAPPVGDIPGCTALLGKLPTGLQNGLNQVPVNFCSPPNPPSADGEYFGVANIGSVGALVSAAKLNFGGGTFPVIPPVGNNPGTGPVTGNPGGTTTTVPGTSSSGFPLTGGTSGQPGGTTTVTTPQVAGGQSTQAVGFVENLAGVSHRLKYLFPAFILAAIGILAGRFGRAPARLPRS